MFRWILAGGVSMAMLLPVVSIMGKPPGGVNPSPTAAKKVAEPLDRKWWVGLMCHPARGAIAVQLGLDNDRGLIVEHIIPNSPSANAGVKKFDILLAAGGKPLQSPRDLAMAVNDSQGRPLELVILRKGKNEEIVVTPLRYQDAKELREKVQIPDSPLQPKDLAKLRNWMEQMERGALGVQVAPMRFRFIRPGVVLPADSKLRFNWPADLSVSIQRHSDKPAQIVVKRGNDRWELTENDLDQLPEDIRERVGQMLGGRMSDLLKPGQLVDFLPSQTDNARFSEMVERRLEEMNRRMDTMLKSLERIQRQQLHQRRPTEDQKGETNRSM